MSDRDSGSQPLWREEFSVQSSEEQYISRRQFGKFLTLTSIGMCAGSAWLFVRSRLEGTPSYPVVSLGLQENIPVGGVKLFDYPGEGDSCLLIRPDEETFVAYSQKCTHLSCAVFYSKETHQIECPCHNGAFSVTSGEVLKGPPPRPLPRIVLENRDGELFAVGIDLQTKV
jgi:Rieske Fe-S protein